MLHHLPRQSALSRSPPVIKHFATSAAASKSVGKVPLPERYQLDRIWKLSRQPKRWDLFQGLRIRITGVTTLFRSEKDLQAWKAMYVCSWIEIVIRRALIAGRKQHSTLSSRAGNLGYMGHGQNVRRKSKALTGKSAVLYVNIKLIR